VLLSFVMGRGWVDILQRRLRAAVGGRVRETTVSAPT
jgi:hypothetical protein